jgi:hypothetical protein
MAAISRAHHLRQAEVADASHQQPRRRRLQHLRPVGSLCGAASAADIPAPSQRPAKPRPPTNSQHGICQQLARVAKVHRRNTEHRLRAPEPARHHDARNRRQHNRAQHRRAPLPDHLFDDKQNRRDRRVERRRKPCRRSNRRKHAQLLARQPILRLISEATPAPICSDGSSGPSECPLPIASADSKNFPITVRDEI